MNPSELESLILKNYSDIVVIQAYRERSFFYNPNGLQKRGIYFVTIKESDGPNDKSSYLNREGIFRLSLGVGKNEYQSLFGSIPKRPPKGEIVKLEYDFTTLRKLMPHPIYSWLGWVCILNPELEDIVSLEKLINIAYNNCLIKNKNKK
jgi:hypothetical protein